MTPFHSNLRDEMGYLTLEEAGALFDVPAATVKKYCSRHKIPVSRIGHNVFISTEKLLKMLEASEVIYAER